MKISKIAPFLLIIGSTPLALGALTSWSGGDGDWDKAGNWSNGVPSTDASFGLNNRSNVIEIAGNVTPQPTTNVPTTFDGYNTPGFSLSNGATLAVTVARFRENGGSTGNSGSIATVTGTGSHLTFNSSAANQGWVLNREQNSTETWTVSNGGTITLNGTGRTDMSFNMTRLTDMNLSGGTIEISAGQVYGTRNDRNQATATVRNEISLDNGSLMNYAGQFQGNMWSVDNYTSFATLNFDLADTASVVRFRNGGVFNTEAKIDSAFGTTFTTSLPGGSLVSTDTGDGYWEVSAIPEPASLGLLAMSLGMIAIRRRR